MATVDVIFTQRFQRPDQRTTKQAVKDKQRQDHQQQGHQIEENDQDGGEVLHAKESAEGTPAALAGAPAKPQTNHRRFCDQEEAARAAA
uniref:hypothetical protein n=1 Tax=Salmonella enterica TaxID=28901 RepID=UPI00398C52C9